MVGSAKKPSAIAAAWTAHQNVLPRSARMAAVMATSKSKAWTA
jgi:hypothetical protein